jgi:hypothetical protein
MDGKSTEVSVGAHRISVTVFGRGEPAVVDSSHEAQEQVLRGALPWRVRVLEALTVPILMALPRSMRNGADRRSIVREFRSIKALTAAVARSAHYIHKSEPGLVTTSIRDVLHSARTGTPLAGTALPESAGLNALRAD